MAKRQLHLDFETYCDLDLKEVGVHQYVAHHSFKILCVAWKLDNSTFIRSALSPSTQRLPPDLIQLLQHPDVQGHAWNAAFETAVIDSLNFMFIANPLSCTMQRALAYGLPGRLDYAGDALGLSVVKNQAGKRLMMKMTRPQKKPVQWTPNDWANLLIYCEDDVAAEAAISEVIPPLTPNEVELSALDRAMNIQGVGVDLDRVDVLMAAAADAEQEAAARCAVLTNGAVTSPGTQTARLQLWLNAQGVSGHAYSKSLPDLARSTVEAHLPDVTDPVVREVLEIRLRLAKASTRKLARMKAMARDGRLYGQFQFCGAGRTGRWSGRGVQVQNLPRVPKGFSPDNFHVLARAWEPQQQGAGLNWISPAPVLDCVSWSLRSCLTGYSSGQAYFGEPLMWGFDFSQIEARVLAWLAGQQDVLDVFAAGDDVYTWTAGRLGSTDRQLGKVLVLALGYGMGANKLRDTAAKNYGVKLTATAAETFKRDWRLQNAHITSFWYAMEDAARAAIKQRGRATLVLTGGAGKRIRFQCTPKTLQMQLPSGRVLYYHSPAIDTDGHLTYRGVEVGGRFDDQYTYGGKLAENATQAVARDIMAEAMQRIFHKLALVPLMTVHDEIVYPLKSQARFSTRVKAQQQGTHCIDRYLLSQLEKLALEAPTWSAGLPIAGEVKIMSRYGVLLKP
jgi:DNA polymerase bacteriophage-type